jgi:nitroimidazol reductase NimA-like FMN-containing flavoprotein (pyridoxamine 5'-phosphate oxidase superfamily)
MFSSLLEESSAVSMGESQVKTLLTEEGMGVLAFQTDGLPYLIPISFGYDGDSTLYFVFLLFGTESRKEELAKDTERGRFLVYRADSAYSWQSVSLAGRIRAVGDDEWDALQNAMENAWQSNIFSAAHPMRGVEGYRFEIESWTGIRQQSDTEA